MLWRSARSFAVVLATISLPIGAAMAAPSASQREDRLAACAKSVDALGAPIGHSEVEERDGRPVYRFLVRSNGLDYRVTCDPATGVVSDVSRAGDLPRAGDQH